MLNQNTKQNTNHLKSMLQIVHLHLKRAKNNYLKIENFVIDDSIFLDDEKVNILDAFIYRFTKMQDFLGDKFFKELLDSIGEYKSNMSLIDVLDKLEKLNLISSTEDWINYRKIRNLLTHEYPEDYTELIENIKLAFMYFNQIKLDIQKIEDYIIVKELV